MKYRRLPAWLLFFSILLPFGFPQKAPLPHDELMARVEALTTNKQFQEIVTLLKPAAEAARQAGVWPLYADYSGEILAALKARRDYDTAQEVVDNIIRTLESAGPEQDLQEARFWVWKALLFRMQERFREALESYQRAIEMYEKRACKGPNLAFSYKNAAQIYLRYSNDRQAIRYLEAALQSDTTQGNNMSIYAQLTQSYLFIDSVPAAVAAYRHGLQEPGSNPNYVASLASAGAALALRSGDLPAASRLTLQALDYYNSDVENGDNRVRSLSTMAEIAQRAGNYRNAESYYREAQSAGKAFYHGKSREMAKLYVDTGLFYEHTNRPDSALFYYQAALIQAFPRFNSLDTGKNPDTSEIPFETQAMRACAAKAQLLVKNPDCSPSQRINAAHCFDLSFAVAAQLRHTYGNDVDKFALAANNREAYQACALNLYAIGSSATERLFTFMEQTKAQALGDALRQQRALALSGIPDSLLRHEDALRREAADALIQFTKRQQEDDSSGWLAGRERWFRLQKAHSRFLEQLEVTYPLFRQYIESDRAADLPAIRATLPNAAALLSWFDAGDRYLCAVLRRDALSAFEVPRDSALDAGLKDFQVLLADKNRQESNPDSFFSAAYQLKQRLLPDSILAGSNKLIIIPDGSLTYLPFEALLTTPHRGAYGTAPYLLRSHAVQYAWSATLLTNTFAADQQGKGLLQAAPFVGTSRDHLPMLTNSLREKPEATSITLLKDSTATAEAFFRDAPEYAILHLSTHAHAGQRSEPVIEFADRAISLPEIYAQRLHASLVSLSACETGAGAFAQGDGVLSLARAFAYAGARSLVASHWSVNERSTSDLFAAFYRFLESGQHKTNALREAKLLLLNQPGIDARKAPYYWAAFTLTGADGPVDINKGWPWWIWVVGGGAIGMGVWLLKRFKT